jgi:cellulose synthase/poly-beta-1,6-N-acetylglucosamine synthase-like glycosyltransferase
MVLPRLIKKGHWKIMLYQGGEREKYTHFEIGGHVQMAKSDPEAQRKSSLLDCTWLENEYGSFNLEALEFLMHFREPGISLYFYTYSYIFFLFSYIYIYSFSFFLFLIKFFYLLPLYSKLHCTYLLPHA